MCFYIFDWAYYIIVQLQFFFLNKYNYINLDKRLYCILENKIFYKDFIYCCKIYNYNYNIDDQFYFKGNDSTRYQEKEVHEPLHLVTNSFLFLLKVVQVTSAGDGRSLAAKLKSIASKSGLLIVLSFSFVVFFQVYCTVAN